MRQVVELDERHLYCAVHLPVSHGVGERVRPARLRVTLRLVELAPSGYVTLGELSWKLASNNTTRLSLAAPRF
jgi:hypothetical protein